MKTQVPEQLKADLPPTKWGKVLSVTPVVMAVVATLLAGLSSSEMTRAQYVRSLAAQQQSKAGDQWSFFQAKRLRGALQRNTVDLMQSMTVVRPFSPSAWKAGIGGVTGAEQARAEVLACVDSAAGQQALGCLQTGETPRLPPPAAVEPKLKAALEGLEKQAPEAEMAPLLAALSETELEQAARAARDQALAFEALTQPVNRTVEQLNEWWTQLAAGAKAEALASSGGLAALHRDFAAARLRYQAARYDGEARLNQAIANLYELQVRKSNITAQRHHTRSQRFFFGMLAAQLGVVVSTLAMAAQRRNLLWSVAAAAGLLAVVFALYVFFYV
jgi:hypothetical protein